MRKEGARKCEYYRSHIIGWGGWKSVTDDVFVVFLLPAFWGAFACPIFLLCCLHVSLCGFKGLT
jgi:hypothetical protein